jgi:hypothetical protein
MKSFLSVPPLYQIVRALQCRATGGQGLRQSIPISQAVAASYGFLSSHAVTGKQFGVRSINAGSYLSDFVPSTQRLR